MPLNNLPFRQVHNESCKLLAPSGRLEAIQIEAAVAGRSDQSRNGYILRGVLVLRADEGPYAGQSHQQEDDAESAACVCEAFARNGTGSDAPLCREEPDAVSEVPADGDHGDDVDGEHDGVGKFLLHLCKCSAGIFRQADSHEALAQDMLTDVEDGYQAGPALSNVHPIAGPRIVDDVGLAAQPDIHAVEAVVEDGQEDECPLEHAHKRQGIEELDLCTVSGGAFECFEVGDEMLDEESANGDDAQQRVELSPEKTGAF